METIVNKEKFALGADEIVLSRNKIEFGKIRLYKSYAYNVAAILERVEEFSDLFICIVNYIKYEKEDAEKEILLKKYRYNSEVEAGLMDYIIETSMQETINDSLKFEFFYEDFPLFEIFVSVSTIEQNFSALKYPKEFSITGTLKFLLNTIKKW